MAIEELDVHSEPGFIILRRQSGPPVKYPLADILRAVDIPTGLTYSQVTAITSLANFIAILIRVLIDKGVITDEEFTDKLGMDWDLDHMIEAIRLMGGNYHDPDFDGIS